MQSAAPRICKEKSLAWLLHFELQPGLRRNLDMRPGRYGHYCSGAGARAGSDRRSPPAAENTAKDASSCCPRANLDRRAFALAGALHGHVIAFDLQDLIPALDTDEHDRQLGVAPQLSRRLGFDDLEDGVAALSRHFLAVNNHRLIDRGLEGLPHV